MRSNQGFCSTRRSAARPASPPSPPLRGSPWRVLLFALRNSRAGRTARPRIVSPPISTSAFGRSSVIGRRRDPIPATRITATRRFHLQFPHFFGSCPLRTGTHLARSRACNDLRKFKKPRQARRTLAGNGRCVHDLDGRRVASKQRPREPIGSITQSGTIRLGKRTDNRVPRIKDFAPLAKLEDIVFGGWDLFADNAYEAAVHAKVLESKDLEPIKEELSAIQADEGRFLSRVRQAAARDAHQDLSEQVRHGGAAARRHSQLHQGTTAVSRAVCVWCGSTEVYLEQGPVHQSIASFEKGLHDSDPSIANSMIVCLGVLERGRALRQRAHRTSPSTSRLRWSWPARHRRPSAARTSRPGRRS